MTYVTKRQLRAELNQAKQDLHKKEERFAPARRKLADLGYAGLEIGYDFVWRRPDGLDARTPEQVDRLLGVQESATRRQVLSDVIEALGIKGYSPATALYDLLGAIGNDDRAIALRAERADLQRQHVDKLWSDLQTTLRVREERKQAEAAAKVEERVSGLLKAGETVHAKADVISGLATNSTLSASIAQTTKTVGDASVTTTKVKSGGKK